MVNYLIADYSAGKHFSFQLSVHDGMLLEKIAAQVTVTELATVKLTKVGTGEQIGQGRCAVRRVGRRESKLVTDIDNCAMEIIIGNRKIALWAMRLNHPRLGKSSVLIDVGIEHVDNEGLEYHPIAWLGKSVEKRYLNFQSIIPIACDESPAFNCDD